MNQPAMRTDRTLIVAEGDVDAPILDEHDKKRKDDAIHTLYVLSRIQLGLCLVLLGSFARIAAATLNSFAPDTLDDAFLDDHLEVTLPLVFVTSMLVAVDFLYFWALTARDLFDLEKKQKEYEEAKNDQKNKRKTQDKLSAEESETILATVTQENEGKLNERKTKIIEVIQHDIFIRQLLIQCDIRQKDLIAAYMDENNKKDIITLLKEFSEGVSLKDYQFLHKDHLSNSRNIEYIQALKLPLRFISILLLMEDRAFECPDVYKKICGQEGIPGYYQFIIVGAILIWALNCYAYRLEFKKTDINVEYDKDIRKIKSTHHNALLSTTILALERKTKGEDAQITYANPGIKEKPFWGRSLIELVSYKWILSACLLGSLARRPVSVFALSGEKNTLETQLVVGFFVGLLLIADIYYMNLSVKEETWKLENSEDTKVMLKACQEVEDKSSNEDELDDTSSDIEKKLYKELHDGNKEVKPEAFKDVHKRLAEFKDFIDQSMGFKFALRAISVAFSFPQLFGVQRGLEDHKIMGLPGNDALMIMAALLGFCIGYTLQNVNAERDKRLNPSKDDPENFLSYTKKTSLFFREPVIKDKDANNPQPTANHLATQPIL